MFINKLLLNMKMSCCMVICTIQNGSLMQIVEEFKYLGLDSNLTFKIHIDNIIRKVCRCLNTLYISINCF